MQRRGPAPRPAVEEDHRLALGVARLLDIQLVPVADGEHERLVGLDLGVEGAQRGHRQTLVPDHSDLDDAVVVVEWGEGVAERLSERHLDIRLERGSDTEMRTAMWQWSRP